MPNLNRKVTVISYTNDLKVNFAIIIVKLFHLSPVPA